MSVASMVDKVQLFVISFQTAQSTIAYDIIQVEDIVQKCFNTL
jgi:hypothetical protein